jgi:thymidylate synthase
MPSPHFAGKTVDDVIRAVIEEILARGNRIYPEKGPADEITGILLEIPDPRARLSQQAVYSLV